MHILQKHDSDKGFWGGGASMGGEPDVLRKMTECGVLKWWAHAWALRSLDCILHDFKFNGVFAGAVHARQCTLCPAGSFSEAGDAL